MKSYLKRLNIILLFGVAFVFCSCCSYDFGEVGVLQQEASGWHHTKVKFNVECIGYDQGDGASRAAGDLWHDGDVVYILLADKDDKKVQAYVKYDGSKQEWGDVVYDGYKSYLTCNAERVAEAYFLEGVNTLNATNISISNGKAVYACTDGSYVYPADGDMTVTVSLKPLTGRIRFEGNANATASVSGLKTFTTFSVATGKFTETTGAVNTMVTSDGSTPYIYGVFADASQPSLTVVTDKTYKTVFDNSTTILQPGKSGFMLLPTVDDHRGWKTLIPVSNVTLTSTVIVLEEGNTTTLVAKVLPEDASDKTLTWASSNTAVATVDNTGKVTAMRDGTATITASPFLDSSIKTTCMVIVDSVGVKSFVVGGVLFKMLLVESGTFRMGSTEYINEKPVHDVTLTNDYYMGETEVTQALWKVVTGYTPTIEGSSWSSFYGLGDDYPAYHISYEDVQSFLSKLNILTGQNFRMPTEAEWEFAAKGGTKSKGYTYSGSNTIDDVAWYTINAYQVGTTSADFGIHKVKTKAPNELHIYDMSGNLWELCSDWFGSYSSSAQTDPAGASSGSYRVARGGDWGSSSAYCRSVYRKDYKPTSHSIDLGFRLVLPAK